MIHICFFLLGGGGGEMLIVTNNNIVAITGDNIIDIFSFSSPTNKNV
jgi:hypothetical protein